MPNQPLKIDVQIHAERASEEFKAARREINRTRKEALLRAAEVAMPEVRRRTPRFAVNHLVIKPTTKTAFITTRGLPRPLSRALGLLEFGGKVTVKVKPKQAAALRTPQGPRGAVNNPRSYKARHFLTGAIESQRDQIDAAILEETMKAFQGRFETELH